MRVLLICHLSSPEIRSYLHQRIPWWERLGRRILRKAPANLADFALWNVNAIHEFEKIEDVELYVVAPSDYIQRNEYRFSIRGVHYFCFRNEDDYFLSRVKKALGFNRHPDYHRNRLYIKNIISEIHPQLVHMIGAENPYYSYSLLDVAPSIPTIVQLQTLMNDPEFLDNFHISKSDYEYRATIEKKVIIAANYIGTTATKYKNIIKKSIKPDATFLDLLLPITEHVDLKERKTVFDFVYFARNISKAVDIAIEAFAIAYKNDKSLTLDIIGNYTVAEKNAIDRHLSELGISHAVTFEGMLPTHEDVLRQVRLSRFALLPLRIDLTSSTVREAMANGLPVVTSDTGPLGTQQLNREDECVLLSPRGDYKAMADNMLKLINDPDLVEKLKNNAGKHSLKIQSNYDKVRCWYESYQFVLGNRANSPKKTSE